MWKLKGTQFISEHVTITITIYCYCNYTCINKYKVYKSTLIGLEKYNAFTETVYKILLYECLINVPHVLSTCPLWNSVLIIWTKLLCPTKTVIIEQFKLYLSI